MKIIIKATNLELSPSINQHIEEKIGSLEKFLDLLHEEDSSEKGRSRAEVFFEVEKTTAHHQEIFRAEAQIKLPRKGLRAESSSQDLRTAINEVKDELQGELKRYKDKVVARSKKRARAFKKRICQS